MKEGGGMLGQRTRRGRGRQRGKDRAQVRGKARAEVMGGADPLIRSYEQGPYPGVQVDPWPPAFVQLVERMTGRPFDPAVFATYERVRGFLGYEAYEMTPALALARVLEDPREDRGAPVGGAPSRRVTPATAPAAAPPSSPNVDPLDLGDD